MPPTEPTSVDAARRASHPLAPLQAGMLFEALLHDVAHGGGGINVEQLHGSVPEAIERGPWVAAWKAVLERHPLLASAFRWEDVDVPLREVHAGVAIPAAYEDLAALSAVDAERRVQAFLREDRRRGIDLGRAPLMRVALFGRGAARSEFVWTFHHALLDGRSFALVLREVFAAYAALRSGLAPVFAPRARDYAEFVSWLERRDSSPSLAYFAALLRGKAGPTPLPCAKAPVSHDEAAGGSSAMSLPPALVDRARALATASSTSLATVAYAAWARVLGRATGDDDVVLGITRAGRRSALDGRTDDMLGLFINTLPLRVRARSAASALLGAIFRQTRALREHDHTPLHLVNATSGFPAGQPLFGTAVMFENHELNATLRALDDAWHGRVLTLHEEPALPLMLTVVGGEGLLLRAFYRTNQFAAPDVERLLGAFAAELAALCDG
jgi:hypothetical protein